MDVDRSNSKSDSYINTSFQAYDQETDIDNLFQSSQKKRKPLSVSKKENVPCFQDPAHEQVSYGIIANIEKELRGAANLFKIERDKYNEEIQELRNIIKDQQIRMENDREMYEERLEQEKRVYEEASYDLQGKIFKLEQEFERLTSEEYRGDDQIIKENWDLKEEIQFKDSHIQNLQKDLETGKKYIESLEQKLEQAEATNSNMIQQSTRLSNTIAYLQTELNRNQDNYSKLKADYFSLKDEFEQICKKPEQGQTQETQRSINANCDGGSEINRSNLVASPLGDYCLFEEQMNETARRIAQLENQLKRTNHQYTSLKKTIKKNSSREEKQKTPRRKRPCRRKTPIDKGHSRNITPLRGR